MVVPPVALMWSGGQPSVQEASGVVGALLQSSLGLISKWHGLTYGCGPSLKEDLRKAVLPLAQALEDLLEAVVRAVLPVLCCANHLCSASVGGAC